MYPTRYSYSICFLPHAEWFDGRIYRLIRVASDSNDVSAGTSYKSAL